MGRVDCLYKCPIGLKQAPEQHGGIKSCVLSVDLTLIYSWNGLKSWKKK